MSIYEQATGKLSSSATGCLATGYSGFGEGKNNPAMQNVADVGPIPCGIYAIGAPFSDPEHGEYCLRLSPDAANQMFGRSGFLMHGDSREHPGMASKGCIVMPYGARVSLWQSGDRELHVIPGGTLVTDPELGT